MSDLWPEEPLDYFEDIQTGKKPLILQPSFSGSMFLQLVNYPIVVCGWEKAAGLHARGRVRREWLKQFNEAERNTIGRYRRHFRRWYLQCGTPTRVNLQLTTLALLQRAVQFFATV